MAKFECIRRGIAMADATNSPSAASAIVEAPHKRTQIYERVSTCGCGCCSSVVPPARLHVRVRTALFRCFHCACTARLQEERAGCSADVSAKDAAYAATMFMFDATWKRSPHTTRLQMSQAKIGAYRVYAFFAPISFEFWRTTAGSE